MNADSKSFFIPIIAVLLISAVLLFLLTMAIPQLPGDAYWFLFVTTFATVMAMLPEDES